MKLRILRKSVGGSTLLNNRQRRLGSAYSKGYTLLEVLLFLAVSSVLLAISTVVLRGQSAHTEFVTSMNDVNTKMQQWIDQVKNGYSAYYGNSASTGSNYSCSTATGSPVLATGGANDNKIGTNIDCVLLGKAIMVNDQSPGAGPTNLTDKIYAYTVLGRRTFVDISGAVASTSTIKDSQPTAAVFPVDSFDPDINLTEAYKIPNGARVWRVWENNNFNQSPRGLVGFYQDPSSSTNSILSVQYPLKVNVDPTDWNGSAWDIPKCINLNLNPQQCNNNGSTPDNLWRLQTWNICFESTRNDERALLQIKSSNASGLGAITTLQLGVSGGNTKCLK